jgi:spermidine synthase
MMEFEPGKRLVKEWLNRDFGFFYTCKKVLHKGKTKHQNIHFLATKELGKVLVLDGNTQVSEIKDFQYHEPMVHPALSAHPRPGRVLVVGGGDGGILREVLKYGGVRKVTLAEIDGEVVKFSRKFLSPMNERALDDPRVEIRITDGRGFVEGHPGRYDVIIMDMTDPFGPSKMLYTKDFFGHVKRALRNRRGIFVMHSESPVTQPDAFASIGKTLRTSFRHVCTLFVYIQMYATLWSISVCSESVDISSLSAGAVDRRLRRRGIRGLKMYNGEVHRAMQVPYPFVGELLRRKGRIITDRRPEIPGTSFGR